MIMRYHWGLAVGHAYTHGNLEVDPSGSTDGASHRDEDEHMDAEGSVMIPEDEQEAGRATISESDEEGRSVVDPANEDEDEDEDGGTDDERGDYLDEEDISDASDEEERDDNDNDEQAAKLVGMYGESQDIEYYQ
jgi:hypothetical protein